MILCIFWAVEHEVVRGGFPNNPIIDKVVHRFREYSCHPAYDRGGVQLQGIYRTVYSKWSSLIDQTYKGTTIPILHA